MPKTIRNLIKTISSGLLTLSLTLSLAGCKDDSRGVAQTPRMGGASKVGEAARASKRPRPSNAAAIADPAALRADPKALGVAVFQAFKAERFASLKPLLIDLGDREAVLDSNELEDSFKQSLLRNWKRAIGGFRRKAESGFLYAIKKAKGDGIDLAAAKVVETKVRSKTERGLVSTAVTLLTEHEGAKYGLKLVLIKSQKGWLLSKIDWAGRWKSDQGWADTFANRLSRLYCRCLDRESTAQKTKDLALLRKHCAEDKSVAEKVKMFDKAGDLKIKTLFLSTYARLKKVCEAKYGGK